MLAIIIPYYKLAFFEKTLQSLVSQTDKRFKVYIGDDASPENPNSLLDKFRDKLDFEYQRFETNLGAISLTKQWERCIALSNNEEWLMILGDDDCIGENVVKEFYSLMKSKKKKRIDLIRFRLNIIDEDDVIQKNNILFKDHETVQKLLERIFSIKEIITASEFIFSRQIYQKNNGFVEFPLAWFSDYATWLIFGKETGIYNIQSESVYWRLSRINISSKSVTVRDIELKVKSLFLFMFFLKKYFNIEKEKLRLFMHTHLMSLLSDTSFFYSIKILVTLLCKLRKSVILLIIGKLILMKVEKKTSKLYEGICTTSRK